MKIIIILLLNISIYAQVVMDNGQCFERKGNMNYIVPCRKQNISDMKPTVDTNSNQIIKTTQENKKESNRCHMMMGLYSIEYKNSLTDTQNILSCSDSMEYIKSMFLGYEKSLSQSKKKIGEVVVKRGFSTCNIELYYGEYISIGLMSGDENMCNDFMAYHSSIRK